MRRLVPLVLVIISIFLMGCGDSFYEYPDTDGIPRNCENPQAAYYRPNIFPRIDMNNLNLALVNWYTGETVSLLTTFGRDNSVGYILNWSANCRYLVVSQYNWTAESPDTHSDAVVFDTLAGTEAARFHNTSTRYAETVGWDPTDTYLIIKAFSPGYHSMTYIQNVVTGNQVSIPVRFTHEYWMLRNHWLIGASDQSVSAYDLNTGAEAVRYLAGHSPSIKIAFASDDSLLAFYNDLATRSADELPGNTVTVEDTNATRHITLNTGYYDQPGAMAFSPDGRYLAIGGNTLSIWDLQNPPDAQEHTPLYQYNGPLSSITALHFVDGATVAATTTDGDSEWNIFTGEQVSNEAR